MLNRLLLVALTIASLVAGPPPLGAEAPSEQVATDGLSGTLVRPAGAKEAVLIIPGSGPTDRDGNSALSGVRTNAYRLLAEELAKAGIASLRYDKRGVAASRNGTDGKPVAEADLTIQTSADDAGRLAAWLGRQAGIGHVALVGHSEGGLVALLAARATAVDRIVLLTAAGFPLGQVLRKQLSRQPLPEEVTAEIDRVLDVLEKGGDPGTLKPPLDQLFRPSVQPFLRSVLTVDPVPLVRDQKAPVLVVGGGSDLQVGRFDFDALVGARAGVESLWLARLTHVLKPMADDDGGQEKAYTDPALPLVPELVERVVRFVKR